MINPKLVAVIKREYLQQVRTKAFWIATFLIPTMGLGFVFLQVLLSKQIVAEGKVKVVDLSGRMYERLQSEYDKAKGKDSQTSSRRRTDKLTLTQVPATAEALPGVRTELNKEVRQGKLKAYIVLDRDILTNGKAEWRAESVRADLVTRERLEELLSRAVMKERLKDLGVEPEIYEKARLNVTLDPHQAQEVETEEGGKNVGFNLAVSGIFFFLIYLSIFIYGAFIMRGVLEEKNNRIVEVIISSIRPAQLMLGKIIGIGLVGLTQYAVWATISVLITLPGVVAMMGVTEGMPSIPPLTVAAFVLFFILGYFLYSSLYAALAAPFNTEQEAQQFVMIPGMMLVFTSITWFIAFDSPNGKLATTLSMFPFTAPLLMFMRISVQPPPVWQIALSVGLLCLSIWGVAWVAGRIYRVGILMYGKKPTLPEIIRWARSSD